MGSLAVQPYAQGQGRSEFARLWGIEKIFFALCTVRAFSVNFMEIEIPWTKTKHWMVSYTIWFLRVQEIYVILERYLHSMLG
jgi:hypothetical protein